jgi:flagellar basal-body rod protein FlgC
MLDSLDKIMDNAATGLSAQSIRMSTIASNLANAGSVGGSEESTYHKKYPVFSEIVKQTQGGDQPSGGVRVSDVKNSTKPLEKKYEPNNPSANSDGFVFTTDVNPIEEMTNMMSASKEYEANVEMMNTIKNLMAQSLSVLKG